MEMATALTPQVKVRPKADIKITGEIDEVLKRITEYKNIVGVIIVNSDGITVKSTVESSLSVQVSFQTDNNFQISFDNFLFILKSTRFLFLNCRNEPSPL